MKKMDSLGLRYETGKLSILDQQLLPAEERWIVVQSPHQMIECIKELKVRGAPLIGVAASLSLAQFAIEGATTEALIEMASALRKARPTAVNLMAAVDRMTEGLSEIDQAHRIEILAKRAQEIFDEDVALCKKMAKNGATLIQEGDGILTHCNTGGLATVGIGTALGVIRQAFEDGKRIHVYVDETRPLLQGGRLTTWELRQLGIPYTLICDSMAAHIMKEGRIQRVFVGADRIARNGDFANKIGTYSVAVQAYFHKIPLYSVAPYTTVDLDCADGSEIPIEQRDPCEVQGVEGSFGSVCWSPKDSQVDNPAFDVTPIEITSGLVLDKGVFTPEQLKGGILSEQIF